MQTETIVFTAPKTAVLLKNETKSMQPDSVAVKMEYTVISGGTERACLTDLPNAGKSFPKYLGYCGVGHVVEIGEQVTSVKPGDRVLVYHGRHSKFNVVPEAKITKVTQQELDSLEAAFVIISTMGLGGVRKLEVELGEDPLFSMGTVFDWRDEP